MRRWLAMFATLVVSTFVVLVPATSQAQVKPGLRVISPAEGARITTTDIPVQVEVSNFKLSAEDVGLPDVDGEGHIHVMIDGMSMGVLFNFYTTPTFTLLGDAITPGKHTLIFDLSTNTHMDMEDTVQHVTIDYQPTNARPAPAAIANAGSPVARITSPADGATVGPQFTVQVDKSNFTPSFGLEGKPNLAGFGHYHVFVDMDAFPMMMMGGMMSMDGMVAMPGSDTIPLDLSAWPPGKHTLTVEPVQDDHTPIEGAKEAVITVNLQGTSGVPKAMDGSTFLGQNAITQAMFNAVWGDRASLRWATEHNHEMHEKMMGGMPPAAAPRAAAPADTGVDLRAKCRERRDWPDGDLDQRWSGCTHRYCRRRLVVRLRLDGARRHVHVHAERGRHVRLSLHVPPVDEGDPHRFSVRFSGKRRGRLAPAA